MKFTHLFAGLLAAISYVSAIDVYIHKDYDCKGNYVLFEAKPPDSCAGVVVDGEYGSVAWLGILTNWHIQVTVHKGGTCKLKIYDQDHPAGSTWHCLSAPRKAGVSGGTYRFVNKLAVREEDICPKDGQCNSTTRPNKVGFADGTVYEISSVDDAQANEILAINARGGSSDEVPASFDGLKVNHTIVR